MELNKFSSTLHRTFPVGWVERIGTAIELHRQKAINNRLAKIYNSPTNEELTSAEIAAAYVSAFATLEVSPNNYVVNVPDAANDSHPSDTEY